MIVCGSSIVGGKGIRQEGGRLLKHYMKATSEHDDGDSLVPFSEVLIFLQLRISVDESPHSLIGLGPVFSENADTNLASSRQLG